MRATVSDASNSDDDLLFDPSRLYGAMVENAPVGIFVHADDRIVFVNPAAVAIFGVSSASAIVGRSPFDFIHASEHELSRERVESMRRGGSVPRTEQRFLRVDGKDFYAETAAAGIDCGSRRGVVVFIRDVTERHTQMAELRRARAAVDLAPDPIFLVDRETLAYVDVNAATCRMLGYSREELLGMGVTDITVGAEADDFRALYAQLAASGEQEVVDPDRVVRHLRRRDGVMIPVEIRRSTVLSGGRELIVAVARDLTERRRAEEALKLRDRAIEASDSSIILVDMRDPAHPIEYVNPAFERMTGFAREEAVGRNCRFLHRDDDRQPELERLREALRKGTDAHVLLRNYQKDGRLFWNRLSISPVRDDDGAITHYVGIAADVTEITTDFHELEHRATHDALTGLGNRQLLEDQLELALAQAERHERSLAVVFVDLDEFKGVNDRLGHAAGDELLRAVAKRLTGSVRDGDTVARTGGDEFVLVLTDQTTTAQLAAVLERLRISLSNPYPVGGGDIPMSCSIGASLYPRHGTTAAQLIHEADRAMYAVKTGGRNGWRIAD